MALVKLAVVQLDRDVEWPDLGTAGSTMSIAQGWDLYRDEAFTFVRVSRTGSEKPPRLFPASRTMYVEDAAVDVLTEPKPAAKRAQAAA